MLNFASELALYPETAPDVQIDCVVGDACDMPQFADDQFDLVHSNSVIEHVGSYQNMRRFSEETRRVGRAYFVQTPNFGFPIEPHYGMPLVHWLPDTVKIWAFSRFTLGYAPRCSFEQARVDHTKIISAGMLRALFHDAQLQRERFGPLTKSLMAIRPAK